MPMRSVLTFYGTGRPVRPFVNLRVNREPSRKGILYSGVRSVSEFRRIVRSKNVIDFRNLGMGAVKLQKSLGISINVTI